ncbi:unnamed protein product, partial [Symbiodinium necroappetens]
AAAPGPRVIDATVVGNWALADDAAFLATFRLPRAEDKTEALAAQHPLPRDTRIVFYEDAHYYEITNPGEEDRPVRAPWSVTGFGKEFHEEFDADGCIDKWFAADRAGLPRSGRGNVYKHADGQWMTREEIKARWSDRTPSARGTLMHFHIEQHLNGCVIAEPHSPEFAQFLAFEREVMQARGLRPFRTELSMFHCGLSLAGQADLLCEEPGGESYAILDWKRSKAIKRWGFRQMRRPFAAYADANFYHYAVQLNMYRYILETEYDMRVGTMLLGIFHPSQTAYQVAEVPDWQDLIREAVEELKRQGRAQDPRPGPLGRFDPHDEE